MASRLRMPALTCTALSIALSIAIIACAANTLRVFNSQQSTNAWLLPIWPDHFDTRGLAVLIGTAAAIIVLDAVIVVSLFVPALPATVMTLGCSLFGAALALLALIFPSLLNNQAPHRDTLQTWTCRWSAATSSAPSQFGNMCHETRFAFFASIPLLVLQLLLLGTAISAVLGSRRAAGHGTPQAADVEKSHKLSQYKRQGSFDTKADGSPKSTATEHARILPVKG